ncbi:MAG: hypothetical protein A2836_00330 [Candidatus Taylorbacteria bacterium RIFCSPHIGHO2_01_FULL_45_63]|uniref:SGNH hydrolase-type esterase domain-containing protein n=1 Tax=Candidatus Taylorbacteria bacterium RIFCSPHIGHO2_02_FULL_45_35 TaxID=1802311 RepID=A0A1G2MVJ3_9BACT|nr:MAG: hypothetical protein A2836_00330 [Candidatus Taylorbacteria bacterium RIFCSPHIGHO2_01_FULL_45_63]OHA27873.1 MAG: hypothetical protein A3D56_01500 [Candidatus Taylorbacteria bacterium RIFCSPHIGHO2_02_FULL_45_35]OHA32435.1 MAG: hypothetical protein A3A22_01065 [Candidatus Taylorbacteria bacterium RIFCSPLOWO2_01_FULL_45_34b]
MKNIRALFFYLLALIAIEKTNSQQNGYSVAAAPTNALTGEQIIARWETPPFSVNFFDWLGVFAVLASNGDWITWKYVTFRNGDTDFVLNQPGVYNFRYFNWDNTLFATSNEVRVEEPAADPTTIRNFPSAGATIVAFGDSLIAGEGATAGNDMVSVLSRLSGKAIVNVGTIGLSTSDAPLRLEADVLPKDPKIVILCLGGKDFIDRVAADITFNNLRQIINRIHEKGSIAILLGVQGGIFTDDFNLRWRQLFEETKCAYVPNILREIVGHFTYSSDLVHPNDKGYEIMAWRVLPVLLRLDPQLDLQSQLDGDNVVLSWYGFSGISYELLCYEELDRGWRTSKSYAGSNHVEKVIINRNDAPRLFWSLRLTHSF